MRIVSLENFKNVVLLHSPTGALKNGEFCTLCYFGIERELGDLLE